MMLSSNILPLPLLLLCSVPIIASTTPTKLLLNSDSRYQLAGNAEPDFNCQRPGIGCTHFAVCGHDGQCKCPAGWGGVDCLIPQCDSLADGDKRRLREEGTSCDCKEGWGDINCNVCQTDPSCADFPLAESDPDDMVCYTGGVTVFSNHRMCKVTNRILVKGLGKPQVTFSCNKASASCSFQFWVQDEDWAIPDAVESWYCALDQCTETTTVDYESTTIAYACDGIQCSCIPGRVMCDPSKMFDMGEFLRDEVKGPASFSCTTGAGCKFEEPKMNEIMWDIFGDPYMTMNCDAGECLRRSQVPEI
ncbi:hypothetical protein C8J57DRAFT_1473786 [Mycena rebaudengoi]|nr:hypothetical protein C8J57DRAFT_1473786 [Mycena rebaudengoi]